MFKSNRDCDSTAKKKKRTRRVSDEKENNKWEPAMEEEENKPCGSENHHPASPQTSRRIKC